MVHPWHDVSPGQHLPGDFQALIEISVGSNVKYELDKQTGLLRLDRVLYSAVYYPANYGFIPRTLAEDDDPLDALVICQAALLPMTIVEARTIGMMTMTDSGRPDHKILAVAKGDPEYQNVHAFQELPDHRVAVFRRFFQDYKILERKSVEVQEFQDVSAALVVIEEALERYRLQHPDTASRSR
jgi:inorganic pyrophosphatase